MTTLDKLDWLRKNWSDLESKGRLMEAIERLVYSDLESENSLENYSAQDIYDIESSIKESCPQYYK